MTIPVSHSTKKHKEVPIEAILDAAENLLGRYGYKRMTMEDLAHAVGLSKGALYLRFDSKEQVALSMIDRLNSRVRAHLAEVLQRPTDPRHKVTQFLVERITVKVNSVRHYCASFDEVYAALQPEIIRRREANTREEIKLLSGAIEAGVCAGIFHVQDSNKVAEHLLLATNGLLPYRLKPEELAKPKELHQRCQALAEFVVLALTNPTTAEITH